MGIGTMIKLLQEKEKKVVLVNIGNFYMAGGKDAILLNKLLKLKLSCLETGICKVGFPIKSLEKYTKEIEEKDYSYVVYKYYPTDIKLEIHKTYIGTEYKTSIKRNKKILKRKIRARDLFLPKLLN